MSTNTLHLPTFTCWETRFETEVCACSCTPSDEMLWIKEVEMDDSMGDLKSSQFMSGKTHWPNFELLDTKIACVTIISHAHAVA